MMDGMNYLTSEKYSSAMGFFDLAGSLLNYGRRLLRKEARRLRS